MQMTVIGTLIADPTTEPKKPIVFFQTGANQSFWFWLEDQSGTKIRCQILRKDLVVGIQNAGEKLNGCRLVAIGRYEHNTEANTPTLTCDLLSVYLNDALRRMENEPLELPGYVTGLVVTKQENAK